MGDTARRIRECLKARGLDWPAAILDFPSLTSTNDLAKERAREGASEWSVITADEQTAGRGRQGHGWASPPGNLFLSVILRPHLGPRQALLIPLAAGVAIAEAVGELGVEARLKWPNDVLADGKKLAGILVEGSGLGTAEASVVVGVGMNLTMTADEAPSEIRESAISIRALSGRAVGVDTAASAVLARLTVWYHALGRKGPDAVLGAWREWSIDWWGQRVEARLGASVLHGLARRVDEQGALVLAQDDGTEVALLSGDVRELRLLDQRQR